MRLGTSLAGALLLALALAGCMGGENENTVGDTTNNDPTSDADMDVVDPQTPADEGGGVTSGEGCIHTTTGVETRGEGDNPCPQGQYPGG